MLIRRSPRAQADAEPAFLDATERALHGALRDLAPTHPFMPVLLGWASEAAIPADAAPVLRAWAVGPPGGGPDADVRHRWTLPVFLGDDARGAEEAGLWRPREIELLREKPQWFADRLMGPMASSSALELLERVATRPERVASETARRLLDEERPVAEDALADAVRARDTWGDSFTLWCHAREDHVLHAFNPLLVALAARLAVAARRTGGVVAGRRFPWFGVPLTSGSAHLADALLRLGIYPSLLPSLVTFVRDAEADDGGFADQAQPPDPLTTLAALDLLAHADPSFDPTRSLAWLARTRAPDGTWAALGPDRPWLTAQIALLVRSLRRPFADRFRWPSVMPWLRDRHTQIPAYGHFLDLVRLFAELHALRDEPIEIAFLDLAGFGAFNTRHGQELGDRVLGFVAGELGGLTAARAIRDGGDEFVVVASPRRAPLHDDLAAVGARWRRRWGSTFGNLPTVWPRALVTTEPGGRLPKARERLGVAIGDLKALHPRPDRAIVERL